MLRKLPFYTLIILGGLAFKFAEGAGESSDGESARWMFVGGTVCWLLAALIWWWQKSGFYKKVSRGQHDRIGALKATGTLIRVPASDCELKENKHAGEYIIYPGDVSSGTEEIFRDMLHLPNKEHPDVATKTHQLHTTIIYRRTNPLSGKRKYLPASPFPKTKLPSPCISTGSAVWDCMSTDTIPTITTSTLPFWISHCELTRRQARM